MADTDMADPSMGAATSLVLSAVNTRGDPSDPKLIKTERGVGYYFGVPVKGVL